MRGYDNWKTRSPYENAVECPHCGEDADEGDNCPSCGEYVMDDRDHAEMRAEIEFDRMRDEGLI